MEVTGLQWHPHDKNMILTSSLDGSLRIWDLLGEALFGNLTCKHVLKIRGATGVARVGATSCCYSPTGTSFCNADAIAILNCRHFLGQRIIGGASDGTIHVWNERKVYGRADIHIKLENTLDQPICSVKIALDNNLLACRCSNGVIGVWDLKTYRTPKKILVDVLNDYPTANVEFR